MLRMLLSHGAPVNGRDGLKCDGDTALLRCTKRAAALRRMDRPRDKLVYRAQFDRWPAPNAAQARQRLVARSDAGGAQLVLEMVSLLLASGADTELYDKRGWRPLHLACEAGDLVLVELLLHCGADAGGCLLESQTERPAAKTHSVASWLARRRRQADLPCRGANFSSHRPCEEFAG